MIPPLMEPFISMVSMVNSKVHEEQQMNKYDSKADVILEQQLKAYYTLITDVWKFLKCYTENLPTDADDWTRIIDRGNSLIRQHGDTEMVRTFVIAAIDEIDRISKFTEVPS